MRRVTAVMSAVLLALLSVAVAEAGLLVLVVLFSSILHLDLNLQLGAELLQMVSPLIPEPTVAIHQAGTVGSVLFTFSCGVGAALWQYRRWRTA